MQIRRINDEAHELTSNSTSKATMRSVRTRRSVIGEFFRRPNHGIVANDLFSPYASWPHCYSESSEGCDFGDSLVAFVAELSVHLFNTKQTRSDNVIRLFTPNDRECCLGESLCDEGACFSEDLTTFIESCAVTCAELLPYISLNSMPL